jgi:hypothetical protein
MMRAVDSVGRARLREPWRKTMTTRPAYATPVDIDTFGVNGITQPPDDLQSLFASPTASRQTG